MYRHEVNDAEKTHIRVQINQFVSNRKINYEVIGKTKSNWDPSKENLMNKPLNINANREYYDKEKRVNYNN